MGSSIHHLMKFLPNFALTYAPLRALLSAIKNPQWRTWVWIQIREIAFNKETDAMKVSSKKAILTTKKKQ